MAPGGKTMPLDANGFSALRHADRLGGLPVLDTDVIMSLRELGGGHDDLLIELIDLFLMDVSERSQELVEATDAGDAHRVSEAAHALKSSSANLGALSLSMVCADVESHARNGNTDTCAPLVMQVGGMLAEVRAALTALRLECR